MFAHVISEVKLIIQLDSIQCPGPPLVPYNCTKLNRFINHYLFKAKVYPGYSIYCLGTEVPRLSAGSILSGDTACTSAGKEHVLRVRACAVRLATIVVRGGAKIMQMEQVPTERHLQKPQSSTELESRLANIKD